MMEKKYKKCKNLLQDILKIWFIMLSIVKFIFRKYKKLKKFINICELEMCKSIGAYT